MQIQVVILHLVLANNPLSAYCTHLSYLLLIFQAVDAIGSGQLERLLYILSVNEDLLVYFSTAMASMLVSGCLGHGFRVRIILWFKSIIQIGFRPVPLI